MGDVLLWFHPDIPVLNFPILLFPGPDQPARPLTIAHESQSMLILSLFFFHSWVTRYAAWISTPSEIQWLLQSHLQTVQLPPISDKQTHPQTKLNIFLSTGHKGTSHPAITVSWRQGQCKSDGCHGGWGSLCTQLTCTFGLSLCLISDVPFPHLDGLLLSHLTL